MFLNILFQPVQQICPSLLDVRLVIGVDVLSLAMHKSVCLSWVDLNMEIDSALLLQMLFQDGHLHERKLPL